MQSQLWASGMIPESLQVFGHWQPAVQFNQEFGLFAETGIGPFRTGQVLNCLAKSPLTL
jgi:hypothetical protein